MSNDVLEQRLGAVEAGLADVKRQLSTPVGGPDPSSRWWENFGPPMTEDQ